MVMLQVLRRLRQLREATGVKSCTRTGAGTPAGEGRGGRDEANVGGWSGAHTDESQSEALPTSRVVAEIYSPLLTAAYVITWYPRGQSARVITSLTAHSKLTYQSMLISSNIDSIFFLIENKRVLISNILFNI